MEASTPRASRANHMLDEADTYVRENPVPAVLWAVGIGFALGVLVKVLDRPTSAEILEEKFDDGKGYLASILRPAAQSTRRAAKRAESRFNDVVESAKDIDPEDYTEPVGKWVSSLWRKCCG